MKNTISFLILAASLLLLNSRGTAQVNGNCKVIFSTLFKGKLYKIESKEASLTLNSKSGDLVLRLNLSSLDAELDTLDRYFDSRDEEMVFNGNTGTPLFNLLNQDENSGQNYPIEGVLTLSRLTANCEGRFNVLKVNNERDELLRNVRFSLFLTFKPADFGLEKLIPGLTGDISLQINEAVVNVAE